MTAPRGPLDRRLSVAPMMEWTDRHCRYFHRLLAPGALLYTEMASAGAVIYGDRERILGFDPAEHPVALQLGGSDPAALARAASIAAAFGYDEINLNVGCPSDRVQTGRFGACLLKEPALVAECVTAMRGAVGVPVTVKTRIGVDDIDDYDHLRAFTAGIAEAGADALIVHARKAWLKGLSPKANRNVPPLDYERVHRLKRDFPALHISINGGIETVAQAREHLRHVDGVMLGRAAYQWPYLLAEAQHWILGDERAPIAREVVLAAFRRYCRRQLARGIKLHSMTRHILGLFQGCPGAKRWRRHLSEAPRRAGAGTEVIDEALALIGSAPGADPWPKIA